MQESINLKRFLDAQDGGTSIDRSRTAYEVALKEILDGKKPATGFGTSSLRDLLALQKWRNATQ